MRALFTCAPAISHFYPLVPVARALAAAGHDVTFAADAALAPAIQHAGFRHRPAGLSFTSPELADIMAQVRHLNSRDAQELAFTRAFAGVFATRMAADLLTLPEAHAADVLIRDNTELGACVAAERLGLPHAAISILSAGLTPGALAWIKEPLNVLRAAHGLRPDHDVAMPFRYLTIHQVPPTFLNETLRPTDHVIRPVPFDRSDDDALPGWLDTLPIRPTVYATLGTVFNGQVDVFQAILAGLRDEPINLIMTVGRNQDPAQFGHQPPHIRIERYIPQSQFLSRCDLVLTHGGSGTTMAALSHGLPLVVTPLGADQPENAARCADLGVGRVIEPGQLTPAAIRDAVRETLSDPSYRHHAERLQREIQQLPGPDYAVGLLTQLAAERRPLVTAA